MSKKAVGKGVNEQINEFLTPVSHKVMVVVLGFTMLLPTGYFGYYVTREDPNNLQENVSVFDDRYHTVTKILDGDTLVLEDGTKVRLIGIDAPEIKACYGTNSKQALTGLVAGKEVYFDKDILATDEFARSLRYVFVRSDNKNDGDLLVNLEMIKRGYAVAQAKAPNRRYQDEFSRANTIADENNTGVWQECRKDLEAKVRQQKTEAPSDSCQIKGNYSEKLRTFNYFMPGCRNYARISVDPARGEQWFCSESAALEAGFARSANCPAGITYPSKLEDQVEE